ncbi:hypothetical protein BOX15_Mlig007674g1 [Macrostomum lignano]|uniref:Ephrin RBD domain-containing protein n=1 Tax=Macrostomum lignano TaxID=282301 RepID=A0A267GCC6_9PLAT|nr:hypothetical protein BOX15_Mlig007674g1 [Macrostomum lignano]
MAASFDPGRAVLTCLLACALSAWLLQGVSAKDRLLYWNISNPLFRAADGKNVYLVPKYDRMVIICPTNGLEFYRLYWTHNLDAAATCQSDHSQVFLLLQCASPGDSGAFQVSDFSPIPGAPTFERTVYIFTPSTGSRSGLFQTQGGACETRNMRLSVDIGNPDLLTKQQPSTATTSQTAKSATTTSVVTAGATSSAGATGRGRWPPGSTATSPDANGPDGRPPPTAQDLARRARTNVIVGANANRPSIGLVAAASLGLTVVCLLL